MFLEALRKVTGTLPSAPPAKRTAKVLNIASGKGGTGKSVVASNLAVLRAQAGERDVGGELGKIRRIIAAEFRFIDR